MAPVFFNIPVFNAYNNFNGSWVWDLSTIYNSILEEGEDREKTFKDK